MNLNSQTVGSKPHDTGRFHPRNLLQLLLALIQRHEEDVSANVTAHYFHHLRAADILSAINFDVIARFHSKAPGAFAVVVEGSDRNSGEKNNPDSKGRPGQTGSSFLGQRPAADGDALLSTQERRFLFRIQVEQPRIVEFFADRLVGLQIQLFLRDGRSFPGHQPRSVVVRESRAKPL